MTVQRSAWATDRGIDAKLPAMPLSGGSHDRASTLRSDPAALEQAWNDPRALVLRVHDGAVALRADSSDLAYLPPGQTDPGAARYFLGMGPDGTPFFAADAPFELGGDERSANVRELSASLPAAASGLFAHAVGLSNWHARHGFCPKCGSPTSVAAAGHVRVCTGCGTEHFPRNDPAVIMLVVDDDDRCLLGHNPAWPPGRFSTLAGFVEPGESLEQAVIREVHEEVGVRVADVRYEGSQPWPFPASLMLGFTAHATDPTISVDVAEITEARWFTREELIIAGKRGEALMPGAISIARWLIELWFGGPLPPDNKW
jgi:NAD+ diphosphatase